MKDPNARQVAGDHYAAKLQHWDFVAQNNLCYFIGQATKYVARAHKKHATPHDDLNKAIHFIEKLQAVNAEREASTPVTFLTIIRHNIDVFMAKLRSTMQAKDMLVLDVPAVDGFSDCSLTQVSIIRGLAMWRTNDDLEEAKALIRSMIPPAVAPYPV